MTGLTVTQDVGFTTLKWNPVAGATDYQIERAPAGTPEATAGTVVGVWQPQRTITPDKPAFADSGFKLGDRFRWRVRARFGTRHGRRAQAVLGAGERRDARPSRPGGAAHGVGEARHRRDGAAPAAVHHHRRGRDVRRRAGRRERPLPAGRAHADDPEPAAGPVHPRLSEAARHRGGDLGPADVLGQLQRARQRGLRPRDVLHDGAPARVHAGPGDPGHAEQDHRC